MRAPTEGRALCRTAPKKHPPGSQPNLRQAKHPPPARSAQLRTGTEYAGRFYDNINARKKAGKSRSKSKSTIDPKVYKSMKAKTGKFSAKKKK